ncbi:hypothetical protein [Dethiobacter alkaliphilus]|uniref:hypothetical protein n=1 Tax=Dethiobacter alkaliphilus TaxID=427926 RepID=UPI002227FEDE|nr:hypothetical protein [Dethiobacter alkaliphilus]MCW3489012.1 hypothetical protein [Dethiobacter alkaliphilus]
MAYKREHGAEQHYIPLGIFKLRLPFIHWRWEWPEALQGLILCATCLGAIPVLTEYLGVSFEVALTMVIINGALYMLHFLLGDPVVPGWITPAVPLVMAFLTRYQIGPERTQAMIALQLLVAIMFLFFGSTGMAAKMVRVIPNSIKAGVILGAGISAIMNVMQVRFSNAPIVITMGTFVAFFILFSAGFKDMKDKYPLLNQIGKYGMLPAIILTLIVGPLVGELPVPQIEWGFAELRIAELISGYTVFGIGFPSLRMFVDALPLMVAIYIIAFGDFVLAETVLRNADENRKDEVLEFNPNRSNLISGIRNGILALISPFTQLAGPLWAAVTVSVSERYKGGRDGMDSYWGGVGSFRIATFISVTLLPIVSLVQPALPVALALTLTVQGFACAYIALGMLNNNYERGVAGFMAVILALQGAAWGLGAGVLLWLCCEWKPRNAVKQEATPVQKAS